MNSPKIHLWGSHQSLKADTFIFPCLCSSSKSKSWTGRKRKCNFAQKEKLKAHLYISKYIKIKFASEIQISGF